MAAKQRVGRTTQDRTSGVSSVAMGGMSAGKHMPMHGSKGMGQGGHRKSTMSGSHQHMGH